MSIHEKLSKTSTRMEELRRVSKSEAVDISKHTVHIPGEINSVDVTIKFSTAEYQERYSVEITRVKARLDGKTYKMPSSLGYLNKMLCKLLLCSEPMGNFYHQQTGVLSVRSTAHNKITVVFCMPYFQSKIRPGKDAGKFTLESGDYGYKATPL